MKKHKIFPYTWHIDEDEEYITSIRFYALDEKNKNICVHVNDFTPFIYLELPTHIKWDEGNAQLLGNKIDTLLGDLKPLKKALVFKKKLFYAHLNKKDKNNKRTKKTFPFLFLSFSTKEDIKKFSYKLNRPINIVGLGCIKLKMHEQDASPILQFTSLRDLSTAGWMEIVGKRLEGEDKLTSCDYEYKVKWKNTKPINDIEIIPQPLILGFDIEVNSTNPTAMPKAEKPGDKVFQISCVLSRGKEEYKKFLLTLGEPDPKIVGKDVEIYMYDTESDLLIGFTDFVNDKNPNVIVGYNILGFDIPYMIARAKQELCIYEFDQLGFLKEAHAREKTIKWSSSAYKNQEFQYLDAEGRLFVDLLPLIKRDYRMNNYRLKTVATFFLNQTKDDLDPKGIFKCYRIGIKKENGKYSNRARRAMGIVGKYCMQDGVLCNKLVDCLQTWVGLCEMAKTCRVPIFFLYTQGQQIKVYSQVYHYCMYNNFVVEKNGYVPSPGEHFQGATVVDPIPGIYNRVVPFDFSSLYPNTIIAYNIDYSTLVEDDSIPDEDCHVMEWYDHVFCLAKGSKITIGEYSMYIENLNNYNGPVLGFDGKDGLTYFDQTSFYDQGLKECVELCFSDGTTLRCTPNHRLLTSNNNWVFAKDININVDDIKCGYSPPIFNVTNQVLVIGDYTFKGKALIIFYKILGLMITDGHCAQGRTIVYVGHPIDVKNIIRDIEYLSQGDKNAYKLRKENYGWGIIIKGSLGEIFRNLEGVLWYKKSIQKRTLPSLLENATNGELCAFLSGLFGGDGNTFSFSNKAGGFGTIALSWKSEEKELLEAIFIKLKKYLLKCGITSTITRLKKISTICIKTSDILKFQEQIGFSYCVHKSMRLEAGCSYLRYKENVWNQQKKLISRIKELKKNMLIDDARKQAIKEMHDQEPIYNEYYASPSKSQVTDLMRDRKKWEKPMFSRKYFIGPDKYIKQINASKLFDSYTVHVDEKTIPCIYKKIIYRKQIGKLPTYDLEIKNSHSFVANGIVVHNCSHDPKIIRKNQLTVYIDKEKDKIKKLREKRNDTLSKYKKYEYKKEIDKMILELKPYVQERSNITKKKPKHNMCAKRYFRFLKSPRGVLPTILEGLLSARAKTRSQIEILKNKLKEEKLSEEEKTSISTFMVVLNKRQLAYKISANSVYGSLGVTRGYLPFMPGAMSTTYMGRQNIRLAGKTIVDKYKGRLIYGDTDSAYVVFPHLTIAHEIWDYAEKVAKEVTMLFPPPNKLEFEEVIYWRYLVLTKKRYMYLNCFRDGKVSDKIGNKGVLLTRRDNCQFIRDIYSGVITRIFNYTTKKEIVDYIIYELNKLCSGVLPYEKFIVSKSVGDNGGLQVLPFIDEKGKKKGQCGNYKVPLLSNESVERKRQFKLKDCDTAKEYYLRCLPAVVQLAEKMKKRGQRVDSGSRLSYVITTKGGHNAKQYVKVEDAKYFSKHQRVLHLDFMYYLKLLTNPMDQVLNIIQAQEERDAGENEKIKHYIKKDFILEQYKYRLKIRGKLLEELNKLFQNKLIFDK